MFLKRSLSGAIQRASSTFKCVLVTGPRQVGKTTLLKELAGSERRMVTLDDPELRTLARRDPRLFLATYPPPVLIDEIQYAPELFPYIKMSVDQSEETGLFWLTGSQPFHLMKRVSESLAGRIAILSLQGLTSAECAGEQERAFLPQIFPATSGTIRTRAAAAEWIYRGAFPQLTANPSTDVNLYMKSYVSTYLARDIRDLVKAEREHEFMTFLSCLAARTGQLLNASNLAQDVGVSPTTVRTWLSILESSGVVFLMPAYRTNLTKRATATPKVYFTDTGLATHLCGIRSAQEVERSAVFGHLLENLAVMAVLKSWWNSGLVCEASFYRDREGHEIDLLIKDNLKLHPVEIKSAASPNVDGIQANFEALLHTGTDLACGAVLCLAEENRPLDRNLMAVNIGSVGRL